MENKFKEVMSKRTDEELIKILTIHKEDYEPDAVKAAELEIEKRKIDIQSFEKIKEKLLAEKKQIEKVDKNVVNPGIRFLNFLIDFIVVMILAFIISFIVGIFVHPTDQGVIQIVGYIIVLGTFIGYYAIMETKFQKTIGKFVTKTKVVKTDGEKPENGDIIARTFYRLIPFDQISFIFTKNGLHDFLSKTKVIKDTTES